MMPTPPTRPDADPRTEVTAARLPATNLGSLAALRSHDGVRVHDLGDGGTVWVTWPIGCRGVVEAMWPIRGAEFFVRRGHAWYRFSHRVPTSNHPPVGSGQPLDTVLVPAKIIPQSPGIGAIPPARIGIVAGGVARPASALRCRARDLLPWADTATTEELRRVTAARSESDVILRGPSLPWIPASTRFWGQALLVPLGFRPDPDLGEDVLRAAAGVASNEVLVLGEAVTDVVPEASFVALTRAAVRMAADRERG